MWQLRPEEWGDGAESYITTTTILKVSATHNHRSCTRVNNDCIVSGFEPTEKLLSRYDRSDKPGVVDLSVYRDIRKLDTTALRWTSLGRHESYTFEAILRLLF